MSRVGNPSVIAMAAPPEDDVANYWLDTPSQKDGRTTAVPFAASKHFYSRKHDMHVPPLAAQSPFADSAVAPHATSSAPADVASPAVPSFHPLPETDSFNEFDSIKFRPTQQPTRTLYNGVGGPKPPVRRPSLAHYAVDYGYLGAEEEQDMGLASRTYEASQSSARERLGIPKPVSPASASHS